VCFPHVLTQMHQIHSELLEKLKRQLDSSEGNIDDDFMLGDIFVTTAPLLNMYIHYVQEFDAQTKILKR
jgi:RhoGEF domain